MMRPFSLADGGTAEVVEIHGEHVVLGSSSASPPGSTLVLSAPDVSRPVRVKVRACRRVEDSVERPFRIEGRFVDVTKAQRAQLLD